MKIVQKTRRDFIQGGLRATAAAALCGLGVLSRDKEGETNCDRSGCKTCGLRKRCTLQRDKDARHVD